MLLSYVLLYSFLFEMIVMRDEMGRVTLCYHTLQSCVISLRMSARVNTLIVCLLFISCMLYFVHALFYFTFNRSLSVVVVPCVRTKILLLLLL